ncbi:hypothetical protein ANCDUO_14656 [Ancylostoma duodenale]|uniref:Uncharacterized protein n=1 Tax=Ancylostoma duodenale TaxID=51022 RepID=A0A0C2GDK7_9BILA|nr:hypothetical protein ANCDUO_14656 [Ancylostoma duodenale]
MVFDTKLAIYPDPEEEVQLNVGGKVFSAKVADLTRISGTMLDRMLDQIWMRSSGIEITVFAPTSRSGAKFQVRNLSSLIGTTSILD